MRVSPAASRAPPRPSRVSTMRAGTANGAKAAPAVGASAARGAGGVVARCGAAHRSAPCTISRARSVYAATPLECTWSKPTSAGSASTAARQSTTDRRRWFVAASLSARFHAFCHEICGWLMFCQTTVRSPMAVSTASMRARQTVASSRQMPTSFEPKPRSTTGGSNPPACQSATVSMADQPLIVV